VQTEATDGGAPAADFADLHRAGFSTVSSYFGRRLAADAQADATKTIFRAAFADWFQDGTAEADDLLLLGRSHLLWRELEPATNCADVLPFPGGAEWNRRWHRISSEDRELLLLSCWEGLRPQDIAEVVGSSTRRVKRRVRAACSALAAELGLDAAAMSSLDPLRGVRQPGEALGRQMLRAISDEGLLISDGSDEGSGRSSGSGSGRNGNRAGGFRSPGSGSGRGRPGSRRRGGSRPLLAALVLAAAGSAALLAGIGLTSPQPVPTPPHTTERVSGNSSPPFTEPTTPRTYGPFEHWSRFEALNASVSFELAPSWTVNSVSTTRGRQSTLYAQVVDHAGAVKAVLSLGSRADVPYTCSLDPAEQGRSVTLDPTAVPGLNPAQPGKVPTFRYQVLDGSPVRSTLGISDGSFDTKPAAGCTEPDLVQQRGAGGLLYVSFSGQENLPYPGRAGSRGGLPSSLVFDTVAQAKAYRATADYANTKRMMTSLRITSEPAPVRSVVLDPATGSPACEISNVRGPNDDTTYEDHPDYFEVLGCAGDWMAFRATYQSAPARPKLIYFAKRDGIGYTYNPDTPWAHVLGWVELTDRAAASSQAPRQEMDHNFKTAGIPVALREKLVGNGP
jgi:hypothetical protein